jgi:hypothetical protein
MREEIPTMMAALMATALNRKTTKSFKANLLAKSRMLFCRMVARETSLRLHIWRPAEAVLRRHALRADMDATLAPREARQGGA